jgi:predicted ATPase
LLIPYLVADTPAPRQHYSDRLLEAVNAVINRGEASQAEVADGIANLVEKSLVASDSTGGGGYFRLLETTRGYALARLAEADELQEFSQRHAEYYQGRSRRQGARSWELRSAVDLAALWAAHGQRGRGLAVLQPIFEKFVEGSDTADLNAAEHPLATLQ